MTSQDSSLLLVTEISKALSVAGHTLKPWDINQILQQLGWQEQRSTGWLATLQASDMGAEARVYKRQNYLVWPESLLARTDFLEAVAVYLLDQQGKDKAFGTVPKAQGCFREKYRAGANIRTQDGYYVRSRAELSIDDWLYTHGIVHAYERRLPIAEEAYCDFYLPNKGADNRDIYIEYWGLEDNPAYAQRKAEKQELYRDNNLRLLELSDADIKKLDDVLLRALSTLP